MSASMEIFQENWTEQSFGDHSILPWDIIIISHRPPWGNSLTFIKKQNRRWIIETEKTIEKYFLLHNYLSVKSFQFFFALFPLGTREASTKFITICTKPYFNKKPRLKPQRVKNLIKRLIGDIPHDVRGSVKWHKQRQNCVTLILTKISNQAIFSFCNNCSQKKKDFLYNLKFILRRVEMKKNFSR